MFILNHTHLLFHQLLNFIFLNFVTSLSTLLHLHFVFLLVHNFCVFYQYQCDSASSQVLSLKFLNTIFFSCTILLFISFIFFFFFPFEVFLFTKCKFILVLRTIFFLSTNFIPIKSWVLTDIYRNTPKHLK